MKKIAIYVHSLARGGAERVSVYLAKYMSENNIETFIITDTIAENEYLIPEKVKRISIGSNVNKYLKYFSNIFKMRKILKELKIDVILAMDLSSCLIAIPATRMLGVKVVVSERNDPTHFSGKKIVEKVSKFLIRYADGYVFQTEDAKSYYKKITNYNGIVIPNPLFTEEIPERFFGKRKKEIVNVGRLSKQKNQRMLIDAFINISEELKEYKLYIYGDGILKSELQEYIIERNMEERIVLKGNQPNVLEQIKDASLFVLSSDYEGMPNALIEALALGIPCISTDCPIGGPRALIKNNENGILVPVNNTNELSNKIKEILNDEEKANKISCKAVEIREKLDANIICKRWKNYLENV